ncbi:MAG TPA: hypothetical protein VLQ45_32825 [Thermoanaerobaculia bacterium]|nr:hypothetical protein [Thermoanaerobaculia bacterium]
MAVGIAIGANDFVTWRDELDSVEGLGAFRTLGRNLIASDGPSELVSVAEITASGFRLARVPPLLGPSASEPVGITFPQTHEHLRPRIVPYTALWFDDLSGWEVRLLQFLLILLLTVVCVNVAILIYADDIYASGMTKSTVGPRP